MGVCRYVFARPSGKRCFVVSSNGTTVSRLRNGCLLHRFPSALPNGARTSRSGQSYCILDCIFHEVLRVGFHYLLSFFFVLSLSFGVILDCLINCSQIKHTMLLIYFVGRGCPSMSVLLNSDFSGWIVSLLRPVFLKLPHITINIDSVLCLSTTATRKVFMQLMQEQCLMSRMDYCFITSKSYFSLNLVQWLFCSLLSFPFLNIFFMSLRILYYNFHLVDLLQFFSLSMFVWRYVSSLTL